MFFPIRTDCPVRQTPYVNYGLIAINIAIFILQKFGTGDGGVGVFHFDLTTLDLDPGEPHLLHFLTYAFLHSGWMHLAGNMAFLYIFGNNVSAKMGQVGYLVFYLAAAIFSGVGYVVTATPIAGIPGEVYAPVLGASGAIAAVTGAFLVLFPRSNVTCVYFFIFFFGTAEFPGLLIVLFFFLTDLVLNAFGGGGVAHTAHIAGTLFGIVVSLALLSARLLDRDQYDLFAWIIRWNRRREYRAAIASGWDPYGTLPPSNVTTPLSHRPGSREAIQEARQQAVLELRAQVSEAMAHRNLPEAAEHYLKLRALDPSQVLSLTYQRDIGNQLAEMGRYGLAAEAYDLFLRHYPQSEDHAHIELLAGVLYARYLDDPQRAMTRLEHALSRLTLPRDIQLATTELQKLRALLPTADNTGSSGTL